MLAVLAGYAQLQACYSDLTTLEVSQVQGTLIIHIEPTGSAACGNLPTAVNVRLLFTRKDLDVQTVLTDFAYGTTLLIQIPVADIKLYVDVKAAQLEIRSYSEVFMQQISQITLTRNSEAEVFSNLLVEYDQKVFTATASFPKAFTTLAVTNATLIVTNFIQSYPLSYDSSSVKTETTAKTISIGFSNKDLSPILYNTGILSIMLVCTYGSNDIEATGKVSTITLSYKGQDSPGVISAVSAYGNNLFLMIDSSESLKTELMKAAQVKLVIEVNDFACTLVAQFAAALLSENIKLNGKLQLNMDEQVFSPVDDGFLQPPECLQLVFDKGESVIVSMALYKDEVPLNRFSFTFANIRKTCFSDTHMVLEAGFIRVTSTNNCPQPKPYKANVTIQLFPTQANQVTNSVTNVATAEFLLDTHLDIEIRIPEAKTIRQIQDAYNYQLLITRANGDFVDSLYPDFQTVTLMEIIFYNIIIIAASMVAGGALGGVIIFGKTKLRMKKLRPKPEMDEI
ncbi:hypothetical protein SS50377_21316 [Spironucleus salmonicida]|uniref:Uncharacterized protein n=1 Tax=Spironucleus salmonicida TaxID=348837 RepID=A0A9P8S091_9EUKA|nr:hypothetical protein SS50377_21316 [Spironucleus salmonicida]